MGVVRGVDRFEGRSSFKTWLFRILVNRARTAGAREPRDLPLSDGEPAVDPSRFDSAGAWAQPLESWADADDRLVAATWSAVPAGGLGELPPRQREIVILRDMEGLPSDDVCDVLGITEGNQRVLLHRGRSRLRSDARVRAGRRGGVDDVATTPRRPGVPAGGGAGDRLPRGRLSRVGPAPVRGPPARVPELHQLPRADAGHHPGHRRPPPGRPHP